MKKILVSLLALAMVSSSFVMAHADGTKPYATATVASEDVTENYNAIMGIIEGAPLGDGQSVYKVTIDFNNLPDLIYGSYDGKSGVRLATCNVKLGMSKTDFDNVVSIFGIAPDDEGFGIESSFSRLGATIEKNALDNTISIVTDTITSPKNGFPTKSALNDEDVDGKLTDVCVFYVVTTNPITVTSIMSDITLFNLNTLESDYKNTVSTNIAIGEAAPPTPSTPDAVKFYAVLPACKKAEASAVAQFQFDDTGDGVADKGYNYDLGSLTWDTDVTVGVEVTNIDDGVTLALTNVLWK